MTSERVTVMGDGFECFEAIVLRGFRERLRGLLRETDPETAPTVLFVPCSSVHTVGMAFAIDICLLDGEGRAVRVERNVGPGRLVAARAAEAVIERPARDGTWIAEGDAVRMLWREAFHELAG